MRISIIVFALIASFSLESNAQGYNSHPYSPTDTTQGEWDWLIYNQLMIQNQIMRDQQMQMEQAQRDRVRRHQVETMMDAFDPYPGDMYGLDW